MTSRIAVIFDFDDTLAPDSTSGFLEHLGLDPDEFWQQRVQPLLDDGWDPIPAYLHQMLEESRNRSPDDRITQQRLQQWGSGISFFKGVQSTFRQLKDVAANVDPTIQLEYYLISSGVGEILRASRIARQFTDIWASEFAYNKRGEIVFPKCVVSFTEKTRFLFQISKGLVGPTARSRPTDVNRRVQSGFRIPLKNMIFVGDGMTDVPCFEIIRRYEGFTIGVYDRHRRNKWGKAWNLVAEKRVDTLCTADYRKNGDLHNALCMAVDHLARKTADETAVI